MEICRMWEELRESELAGEAAWIETERNVCSHALGLRNLISIPFLFIPSFCRFLGSCYHLFNSFLFVRPYQVLIPQNSFFIVLSGLYKPKSDHVHLSTYKS